MKYTPAFAFLTAILICGLCIQPVLAEATEEALQAVETAINLNPNNANFWNSKGRILEGLHRFPEALDAFDKALSIEEQYFGPDGKTRRGTFCGRKGTCHRFRQGGFLEFQGVRAA
jgi:tetratricopeptide (TPR) repeat protein